MPEWYEMMDDLDGPEQECHALDAHVTNSHNGGKVTCYKCNGFILYKDVVSYLDHQHRDEFPRVHFHKECYNPYEHYYGLDKPNRD